MVFLTKIHPDFSEMVILRNGHGDGHEELEMDMGNGHGELDMDMGDGHGDGHGVMMEMGMEMVMEDGHGDGHGRWTWRWSLSTEGSGRRFFTLGTP